MVEIAKPNRLLGRRIGITTPASCVEAASVGEAHSKPSDEQRAGWSIHDRSLSDYGNTFYKVLPNEFLTDYLKNRPEGQRNSIIDLMASEQAVAEAVLDLGYDFGVAVSLGFPPNKKFAARANGRIRSVNGDIASEGTWRAVRSVMTEHTPSGFDIVISRAEGGLSPSYIPSAPLLYYFLLQRIWSITAQTGIILLQVPEYNSTDSVAYFKKLQEMGFDVQLPPTKEAKYPMEYSRRFGYPVRISRKPTDPKRLPSPLTLGM